MLLGAKENKSTAINEDHISEEEKESDDDDDEDKQFSQERFLIAAKGDSIENFRRLRIDSTKTVDESEEEESERDNLSNDSIETDSDLSILDSSSDEDLDQDDKAL